MRLLQTARKLILEVSDLLGQQFQLQIGFVLIFSEFFKSLRLGILVVLVTGHNRACAAESAHRWLTFDCAHLRDSLLVERDQLFRRQYYTLLAG